MSLATNASPNISSPVKTLRWHHWLILAGLIAIGAGLRFHQITKVGLWPDEFWSSVHLATGRGTAVFDLPSDVLIQPPPQTLLEGAPPWWHIWTGLRGIVHPPVYLILLRWWMDLFGSSDLSTRTFSALASLAGAVMLFDILRRTVCIHAGLIAATLMAISPLQINLSQESRPYPLLMLSALIACHALFRIEQNGASTGRLLQLGAAMAATAMIHYFSLGALLAMFGYAAIRLRGSDRRKTIGTIFAAAIFVLIVWGPFLWQQHREFFRQQSWSLESYGNTAMPWIRSAAIPAAFLYGRPGGELAWIAPCIIAYLMPWLLIRRYPTALLWWLWIVGIIGSLIIYDVVNHARLLATIKYVSLASVAIYALCATPLPIQRWRWIVAYVVLAGTAIASVQRIQEGPPESNGDWRGMALELDQKAGPNDPLIFYPNPFWGPPGMYFLAVAHYAHDSHRPVMYLNAPADSAALAQLMKFKTIWLIGPNAGTDASKYLPGWTQRFNRGYPNSGSIAELTRPVLMPSTR